MIKIFPLYRKYPNNKSYFKLLSENEFEEIQFIGDKGFIFRFEAKILPDRYLISDMIELKDKTWVEIEPEEYDNQLRKLK